MDALPKGTDFFTGPSLMGFSLAGSAECPAARQGCIQEGDGLSAKALAPGGGRHWDPERYRAGTAGHSDRRRKK